MSEFWAGLSGVIVGAILSLIGSLVVSRWAAGSRLGGARPRLSGFTMSVYQHVREGMAEQAADAIERAFGG